MIEKTIRRYKGLIKWSGFTEDLKQYRENQEQLELKVEAGDARQREELAVTLNKREDRLRKRRSSWTRS